MINREELEEKISKLYINKGNIGCIILDELLVIANETNSLYQYMHEFFKMLDNDNSYVRNRAIFLIGYNAKWDTDNIINKNIYKLLIHLHDPKPITTRQLLKILPLIINNKPELKMMIVEKIINLDTSIYQESMKNLIDKDINNILENIK